MEKKQGTPRKITLQRCNAIFPVVGSRTVRTAASAAASATAASSSQEEHTATTGMPLPTTCTSSSTIREDISSPGPQPLLYLEESEELVVVSIEAGGEEQEEGLGAPSRPSSVLPSSSSTPPTTPISSQSQASSQGGGDSGIAPTPSHQQTSSSSSSSSNIARPRGSLWEYFSSEEDDPRLATCSVCKVVVRRGTDPRHLSSSALRTHLQRHHPKLLPLPPPLGTGKKRGLVEEGRDRETEAGVTAKRPAGSSTTEGGQTSRQATLQDMLPVGGIERVSRRARGRVQEAATRVVGEMVALSGVPLSFVESPGFRHLLKYLAPWYQPPSRRTLSRSVIPSLQESVREMVRGQLRRVKGRKIHFTSDLWSGGHHSYLSLTAHWWQPEDVSAAGIGAPEVGPQGEAPIKPPAGYRVALLQARSMDDSATGKNISEELLSALREWAPEGGLKRGHMVTDAGRNMSAAVREAGFEGIVCLAHKIHLVVRDALGLGSQVRETWSAGTKDTRTLLEKCRQLVGHFSRSVKAARLLREKQQQLRMAQHVLLQDMPTRWNSTFEMVSRLVEQKAVLEDMMSTTPILPGGRELDIGATDWLALSQMVDVLKPFEETTKAVCGLDASLGHVIPLIRALDRSLASFLEVDDSSILPRSRALVLRLQAGVRQRLHPLCRDRVYQLSCLCDPRVKGSLASSPVELQEWKTELALEVRRALEAQGGHTLPGMQRRPFELGGGSSQEEYCQQQSGRACQRPVKPTPPPPFLASVIAWAVSSSGEERQAEDQDAAESMVTEYMSAPFLPPTSDPLSYWASKAEVWPQLSAVAMDFLSIPPTSVQSERVFSQLGDILRPRRSRLDPGTVEGLAFMRFNISVMGFPSSTK